MKKTAVIAFIVSLLLYSCNQNKPASQIPVVGEPVDSVAIANDTTQQTSLEESYEYAQSVVVSPKLVYDVRAYGGPPSHGQYCIIRRGADNKPDTVVQRERFGVIVNAFTGDLNKNGKEEIYLVTRKTEPYSTSEVIAFEFDQAGVASPLSFEKAGINFSTHEDTIHPKSDSIFIISKTHVLMKKYLKGNNPFMDHAYDLIGTKFGLLHYN
jgi:hypothetical protein